MSHLFVFIKHLQVNVAKVLDVNASPANETLVAVYESNSKTFVTICVKYHQFT